MSILAEGASASHPPTALLLQDKICLIAGVSSLRGIGFATAEQFARHGASLVIVDVMMTKEDSHRLSDALTARLDFEPRVLGLTCDIESQSDCQNVVNAAIDHFGTLDVLVNTAGIVKSDSMLSIDSQDLDRLIGVNLKGAFNICQSALRVFADCESGSIVNVASVAAQRGGGLVGGAHYAASKGGILSLTRSIAREFGPKGIRANAICPSMTDTGMLDGNVSEEQYDQIVNSVPLRRAAKPIDIANACLFLASDLSAYITGATLDVNGGSHIH